MKKTYAKFNQNNLIIGAIVVVIVIIGIYYFYPKNVASGKYDSFAQCLASKNITMYGAYWCPHCQNEKRAFGDSFRYVPYVECTEDVQKCLNAGIRGYPTWIFPDGNKLVGFQELQKLSEASSCPLPK